MDPGASDILCAKRKLKDAALGITKSQEDSVFVVVVGAYCSFKVWKNYKAGVIVFWLKSIFQLKLLGKKI